MQQNIIAIRSTSVDCSPQIVLASRSSAAHLWSQHVLHGTVSRPSQSSIKLCLLIATISSPLVFADFTKFPAPLSFAGNIAQPTLPPPSQCVQVFISTSISPRPLQSQLFAAHPPVFISPDSFDLSRAIVASHLSDSLLGFAIA